MTRQLTLFDVRPSDPETSHAAAKKANHGRGQTLALRALAEHGPSTDFELAEHTGLQQTSIGKRRLDLQRLGHVRATEDRRPSPTGSGAIVWALTDAGHRAAAELEWA